MTRIVMAVLVWPMLELLLFIEIVQAFGFSALILWILGTGIVGLWLMRITWGSWRNPASGVPADQVLLWFAGLLLLLPGVITDGLGLILLLPPVRTFVRQRIRRRLGDRWVWLQNPSDY